MASMTLLEMVQDILSDLDAENVTAITDTVEAGQVAKVLESTYFGLVADREKPEHKELFNLTETDANSPSVMIIPTAVMRVDWIMLDVRTSEVAGIPRAYEEIPYVTPAEFLVRTSGRNDTETSVDILDSATYTGSTELMIKNSRSPEYYTSFDDSALIFDSYDSAIDTFLLAAKSQGYGVVEPSWTESDSFVPDIDAQVFPLFLSKAKQRASVVLRQATNPMEIQWGRKLEVIDQFNNHRARDLKRQTDFGRPGGRQRHTPLNRSN